MAAMPARYGKPKPRQLREACRIRAGVRHIATVSVKSLSQVRDHFSEVVDRVEREQERVTVTRNGHPVAVIVSPEDLAQLEGTLEFLSDPETLAEIRKGRRGPPSR
jgi:prevent-host-death family protein